MARTPIYQQTETLRPALRQGIEVRSTPETFGADIGRGMEGLGRGMDKAADAFAQLQALEDAARAKEADNAYASWLRERQYGENGFMTLEGRNAVDGRAAFEREAEEKRKEIGKSLTGGAARSYSNASNARLQSTLQQSIIHTANQRKKWFGDASAARVQTFADDALVNYDKPALVDKSIAAGVLELRQQGQMHGWDADTLKVREAGYVSGVHKTIALRMAQSDPIAAENYIKANKDRMSGDDQYAVTKALEKEIQNEHSKRNADEILQSGQKPERTMGQSGPRNARAFLMGRLSKGHGASHVDGLDETFATNLAALMQDAPPEIRDGLGIISGHRTVERQRELWAEAIQKYGSAEAARKWVAPPGQSKHNHGQAVDIGYNGRSLAHAPKEVVEWVHANAGKYGLRFPMAHEPWHIEPAGARSGTVAPSGNVVSPRALYPSASEIEGRLDAIADRDVRELTRKRINAALESQSRAYEEQQRAAKAELWRFVDQGMTPDQVPMDIRQRAGMSAVSAAWGYLDTVAKGRAVEGDDQLMYSMRRYAAASPSEFARIDLNDYRDRLSKEQIKELTGQQQTAIADQRKAKEHGANLTAAYSQATQQLAAVGISTAGKKGDARVQTEARIARFNNALTDEVAAFKQANNGRDPTQADIQTMINKLLLPIVVRTPGTLWGTNNWLPPGVKDGWLSSPDIFAFESGGRPDNSSVEVKVKYADIPINIRRGISADLERELGRKPSEEEVANRYEVFVLGK